MARLRVAGIGAGQFSRFHHDAWTRLPDVDLVAVCDPDPARANEAARRFGVPRTYGDAAEMLDRERPDLVDIVAPPTTHAPLIAACAARGIDTICQKAFCRDLAEAEAATALAEDAGIRLVVHENFRFQPWYRELRRQLLAGRIGEPYEIAFRLRTGDGRGPDAYLDRQPYFRSMPRFLLRETGIHFIDTFRFLFGEVSAVYAGLARLNPAIAGEDAALLLFDFANGRRGLFDGNRLVDHPAPNPRLTLGEMLIEGSDGVLKLDGRGHIHLRALGAASWTELPYAWEERATGGDSVFALQRHLVDHILRGAPVENRARDYLPNLRIEAAAYDSAARGVRVPLA
jgi:predicted dehydrogenase